MTAQYAIIIAGAVMIAAVMASAMARAWRGE